MKGRVQVASIPAIIGGHREIHSVSFNRIEDVNNLGFAY
jgi:hypothetical protein